MHAHIKATESVILMLSLSTGSGTLLPRPHARDSSGCRHSEHTTHPPAQPPHPQHQIHLQESQPPSRTRTSSSSTRAQGPTRRRTVTIVIITRGVVAGVSQLIGGTEEKECNKRERDGAQWMQRESRQNEERAAGPAAQLTHHETASTQGRQTTPAATHHAGGEDILHHLHSAHSCSTHHTRQKRKQTLIHPRGGNKFPAIPPSMEHGAQLNAVTRGASHPQENRLGVRSLSLLLMATEEDNNRHT
ncbi:hypothetical protein TcCL_Unassigned01105 [Trypanosoma cruzi]|nr:hypothetical protein TcCL_Unassigned01105 [Trypanosoma cruzi]